MNEATHPHYPLFLDLAGRRVLVVGGNEVARRKTARLLRAGARVEILATSLDPELDQLHRDGRIRWIDRQWTGDRSPPASLSDYWLVVIAEADSFSRARLAREAERLRVWVNSVDDPAHSSALVPAVVDRGAVQVAIGTGGRAPELARMIRTRLEALLPASLGPLAALAGRHAAAIRRRFPASAPRRRFLAWLFNAEPADELAAGRGEQAERLVRDALAGGKFTPRGRVWLVGAGPGDPELLTVRALRLIGQADTIIHDGLVDERILEHARRDALLISAAKRCGNPRSSQEQINRLLIEHAERGERVVRLKGGDPLVFARGGEELTELAAHGVAFEIVPGLTAASACAAYAGIPLTHRDHAQSVHLVTAHCRNSIDRLDWPALAAHRQTLAFYMAVAQLGLIEHKLLAHGRSPDTPAALVENGTRPNQRVILTRLDALTTTAREHEVKSPAMLYIGEVAALAGQLGWFGGRVDKTENAIGQVRAAGALPPQAIGY